MTYEQVSKILQKYETQTFLISFKNRTAVEGLFIKGSDYDALRRKNFWRIVTMAHMEAYLESNDNGLAKIFYGDSFTRLSMV